ncbi:Fic family protein [Gordonia sp. TBRC 11910]|uniref:Fic family protein n=1 Tax=Gordonia asplenii TaxID=2725283 RepID=A0A848KX47_9ACTN|nr:Fic/DOC family N-terminal domain-containing protein [Gordonia asplenii]NMO02657.1 Fic family protein [Gordonia asplenii]
MPRRWDPNTPFNALPPPPPADLLETRRVLKAAIGANAAVAKLNQAAKSIPNSTVLINTIPMLEAQASSEIENIVTTTDDLFRFLDDESSADSAVRETLRYRTALRVGSEHARERGLTAATATVVCSAVKGRDMRVRDLPGTRLANPVTMAVTYSPPEGRDTILDKLRSWEEFLHRADELDVLVRMAVAHYQFEAIHPFSDGNGRTGRILNILLLQEAELLHAPILYLSKYIISTKDEYYRRLLAVTSHGEWEEWILYMLRGVEATARSAARKVEAISDLQRDFALQARAVTRGGADSELQSVLFEQPYCRIGIVSQRCGVSRPTATSRLTALAKAGLLQDVKAGRDRLFINRQFLDLLVRRELAD